MARKSKKKVVTVEQIDAQLAKWMSTIIRATRTIERLQRMRKRAVRKAAEADLAIAPPLAKPVAPKAVVTTGEILTGLKSAPPAVRLAVRLLDEMAAEGAAESVERPAEKPAQPPAADDLALPDFLRRSKADPVAEQIRAEQEEIKRAKARGRIEKMKAKQRGDTKRMPLTGKAALAAIRNG